MASQIVLVPAPHSDHIRVIPLTKGKNAIIDASDYGLVSQYLWSAHQDKEKEHHKERWYARASTPRDHNGKQWTIQMHRLILGLTDSRIQVDHKDGNGLNNTRINLRVASNSQNCCNRRYNSKSGFRGVYAIGNRYRAAITFQDKFSHLGVFLTPEEAAVAYDRAARVLHGEFACLNFPEIIT